ncbi:MAG: hypothetical protein RL485_271, partial [Bacteroidota bacterium]
PKPNKKGFLAEALFSWCTAEAYAFASSA